ncbi:MAG TPA: DUF4190 domain-containing protein [Nocardioides sp.]|nr:DUF4190 domain-containing protein [Nocardioides sp.]
MSYPPYEPPQGPPYGSQPYGGPPLYQAPRPTNSLAMASMVTSVVAAVGTLLCCLPGLFGIAGAVMGHVAKGQIRARGDQGDGLALAGIIVGWVTAALSVVGIVVVVILIAHSSGDVGDPSTSSL